MAPSRSRQLLHRIALVAFVALLGVGIALRDIEAILFAVAVLVGIFLLPLRNGLLGRIVLAVVFIDTLGWMAPAAYSNLEHRDAIVCVAVPVGLAATIWPDVAECARLSLVPIAVVVCVGITGGGGRRRTASRRGRRTTGRR